MLLTSLLKYRSTIRAWSQTETLLGLLRQTGTEAAFADDLLRVYGSPPEGERFLASISWTPPTVVAPWTGYALAPGAIPGSRTLETSTRSGSPLARLGTGGGVGQVPLRASS